MLLSGFFLDFFYLIWFRTHCAATGIYVTLKLFLICLSSFKWCIICYA